MAFTKVAFFITFAIAITKAAGDDDCHSCTHKDDCYIMKGHSVYQQELWMMIHQCQPLYGGKNLYEYVPGGGGDFVCCSKIAEEIEYSRKYSKQIVDYYGRNNFDRNQISRAPARIDDFYRNMNPIYKQNIHDPRTIGSKISRFNNYQLPQRPYATGVPHNAQRFFGDEQYLKEQCAPTSFPPVPQTGCCGREATDTERTTGRYNIQSVDDLVNVLNRRPDNNAFPPLSNNQLKFLKPRQSESVRNQRKRSIPETPVNITIDQRIAGGKETEFEQFPWTVLVKATFDYGNRRESFNCGGALISSKYVLTAAHCLHDANGTLTDVEVFLAEYNKQTFPIDCKNVLGVGQKCIENLQMYGEEIILHSQFESKGLTNDIALIRLRDVAPYTNYIRPICILPMNIDSPEFSDLSLAVAGWGRNGPYRSDIKQSTVVKLVAQEQCKKYYSALTTKHLCAVGDTGEDTCKGDSGGPLMTVYGGKHFVVGLVSGKRADYPCGTSVPSLYTNVYNYLDWISSNIKN